jgi:hypothetical protein
MSYKKDTKPYGKKPEYPSYEKLGGGHTFEVTDYGKLPEGTHFWCAFCGGRLYEFIEIKRDDGKKYKVGETCLGRVGLVIPKQEKILLDVDALTFLGEV